MAIRDVEQAAFFAKYGPGKPIIHGKPYGAVEDVECRAITAVIEHFKMRRILEIGAHTGATAEAILKGNTSIEAHYALDIDESAYFPSTTTFKRGMFVKDPRYHLLVTAGGSADFPRDVIKDFDLVFVDGDHTAKWVEFDTRLAYDVLRPEGVVFWHDYECPEGRNPDVKTFIDAENARNGGRIVRLKGTVLCFQFVGGDAW